MGINNGPPQHVNCRCVMVCTPSTEDWMRKYYHLCPSEEDLGLVGTGLYDRMIGFLVYDTFKEERHGTENC